MSTLTLFFFLLSLAFADKTSFKEVADLPKPYYRAIYKGTFPPTPSPVKNRWRRSKGNGNAHALLIYSLLGGVILITFLAGLSLFFWHSSKSTKLKDIATYFDIISKKRKLNPITDPALEQHQEL